MIDSRNNGLTVLQPASWPRPKGYANGIAADGRIVVTGGVVGWNAAAEFPDSLPAQAAQVFDNILAIFKEAGAGPQHVIRLTWYLTDMEDYLACQRELGEIYRKAFGAHYPAMAVMQVVRLAEPAAKIEIEAMAVIPR